MMPKDFSMNLEKEEHCFLMSTTSLMYKTKLLKKMRKKIKTIRKTQLKRIKKKKNKGRHSLQQEDF
jgi:hypothetical protein